MVNEALDQACDTLSNTVDSMLFERLRWEREEGPMLAKLVALAHGALEERPDFDLSEEGSTSDIKRFTLKIHSNRVVAVMFWLEDRQALVSAESIERSKYVLSDGPTIKAQYKDVNEAWMADALRQVFARVSAT